MLPPPLFLLPPNSQMSSSFAPAEVKTEIVGGRAAISQKCDIPIEDIRGYRSPYLTTTPVQREVRGRPCMLQPPLACAARWSCWERGVSHGGTHCAAPVDALCCSVCRRCTPTASCGTGGWLGAGAQPGGRCAARGAVAAVCAYLCPHSPTPDSVPPARTWHLSACSTLMETETGDSISNGMSQRLWPCERPAAARHALLQAHSPLSRASLFTRAPPSRAACCRYPGLWHCPRLQLVSWCRAPGPGGGGACGSVTLRPPCCRCLPSLQVRPGADVQRQRALPWHVERAR